MSVVLKEEAKREIQKLISNFEGKTDYYLKTDEGNIETKLLEPLFYALGWTTEDFEKREKVRRKEGRGVSDYAFKLNERTVFFLEAKRVSVDIDTDKSTWKQAISYALSKKVSFAVLSNFKSLKIFCVEQENSLNNQFRDIKYTEFITRFDDLWLLSKESFEKNSIMDMAIREQRLKKRVSLDSELLEDLMYARKLIANNIEEKYPNRYEINEKDDIIQRLLDRLIFIRRAEDIGINRDNKSNYLELLQEISHSPDNKIYPKLKDLFSKYNEIYNSGLFAKGVDSDIDSIYLDGDIIKKLISHLYESRNHEYIYNFDWIDADVLGQVYEQYLGKILLQTKSRISKLKNGQAHKKEQGIYYTPIYIVDYIVRNTLGELLRNKKLDVETIRVLDPACGSGSFLIKAFDFVYEGYKKKLDVKQKRLDDEGLYSIKTEILKKNIFGVDLDNKAVEITKLNLLLKAAEAGRKLPKEIDSNIRSGNSLIDDEKVAGDKAFKWEKEFKQIIDEGGFDVVIGNPPYVDGRKIDDVEKRYYQNTFESATGKLNTFVLFIERSSFLLKEGGRLSFITHKNLLRSNHYAGIRKFILDNYIIEQILDLKSMVFEEVTGEMCIIILKKTRTESKRRKNKIKVITNIKDTTFKYSEIHYVLQDFLNKLLDYRFNTLLTEKVLEIITKMKNDSIELFDIVNFSTGIDVGNEEKYISNERINDNYHKILRGRNIFKYSQSFNNEYVYYSRHVLNRARDESIFLQKEKILSQHISNKLIGTLDCEQYYALQTINILYSKNKKYDLRFILGIFNSKLMNFYYEVCFNLGSDFTTAISTINLQRLPIKITSDFNQQHIIKLVDKMLYFNKRLNEIGDKKTDESARIKEEIKKTDTEIDELVYKIYGINEGEKKIIDESLK